jgi:hypothetical protein
MHGVPHGEADPKGNEDGHSDAYPDGRGSLYLDHRWVVVGHDGNATSGKWSIGG